MEEIVLVEAPRDFEAQGRESVARLDWSVLMEWFGCLPELGWRLAGLVEGGAARCRDEVATERPALGEVEVDEVGSSAISSSDPGSAYEMGAAVVLRDERRVRRAGAGGVAVLEAVTVGCESELVMDVTDTTSTTSTGIFSSLVGCVSCAALVLALLVLRRRCGFRCADTVPARSVCGDTISGLLLCVSDCCFEFSGGSSRGFGTLPQKAASPEYACLARFAGREEVGRGRFGESAGFVSPVCLVLMPNAAKSDT